MFTVTWYDLLSINHCWMLSRIFVSIYLLIPVTVLIIISVNQSDIVICLQVYVGFPSCPVACFKCCEMLEGVSNVETYYSCNQHTLTLTVHSSHVWLWVFHMLWKHLTFYPGVGSLPLLGRLSNAVGQHSHHHHVSSLQGEDGGDGGESGGNGGESSEDGGDDKYLWSYSHILKTCIRGKDPRSKISMADHSIKCKINLLKLKDGWSSN